MNPEVKELWIAALESGDYRQGRLALKDDGKYCCLGVLCELASRAISLEVEVEVDYDDNSTTSYDGETGYLPLSVQEWAEIDNKVGRLSNSIQDENGIHWSLSQLNDGGYSFKEIAEVIREQF